MVGRRPQGSCGGCG